MREWKKERGSGSGRVAVWLLERKRTVGGGDGLVRSWNLDEVERLGFEEGHQMQEMARGKSDCEGVALATVSGTSAEEIQKRVAPSTQFPSMNANKSTPTPPSALLAQAQSVGCRFGSFS